VTAGAVLFAEKQEYTHVFSALPCKQMHCNVRINKYNQTLENGEVTKHGYITCSGFMAGHGESP